MNPAGSIHQGNWTPGLTPRAAVELLEHMLDELLELKALVRGAPAVPDEFLLDQMAHCAHRISLAAEKRFLTIAKKAREVAWVVDEIVVGYGESDMAQLKRRVIILEDHLRRTLAFADERAHTASP